MVENYMWGIENKNLTSELKAYLLRQNTGKSEPNNKDSI